MVIICRKVFREILTFLCWCGLEKKEWKCPWFIWWKSMMLIEHSAHDSHLPFLFSASEIGENAAVTPTKNTVMPQWLLQKKIENYFLLPFILIRVLIIAGQAIFWWEKLSFENFDEGAPKLFLMGWGPPLNKGHDGRVHTRKNFLACIHEKLSFTGFYGRK